MSDVTGVSYSSGVKQSFMQKAAYLAADEFGGDVSIFMNAMEKTGMKTTIDDLLKESGGEIPNNFECKSFAEKLIDSVKGFFTPKTDENQPADLTQKQQDEKDELNFTFETKTDVE